jgi:photosystem II stability/assembly factor-like uncharacterized protein
MSCSDHSEFGALRSLFAGADEALAITTSPLYSSWLKAQADDKEYLVFNSNGTLALKKRCPQSGEHTVLSIESPFTLTATHIEVTQGQEKSSAACHLSLKAGRYQYLLLNDEYLLLTDGTATFSFTRELFEDNLWRLPHNSATFTSLASDNVNDLYLDGEKLYAATDRGLSISSDDGKSWTTRTAANGFPVDNVLRVVADGPHIYVATAQGLALSHDNGLSWRTIDKKTLPLLAHGGVQALFAKGNMILAGTKRGLLISKDRGASWLIKDVYHGLASSDINSMYAHADTISVATSAGLSISTDGGQSWRTLEATSGLPSGYVSNLVSDGGTLHLRVSTGIATSVDHGASWDIKPTQELDGQVYHLAAHNSALYAGTYSRGVGVSHDQGASWEFSGPSGEPLSYGFRRIAVKEGKIFRTASTGVGVATDKGASWNLIRSEFQLQKLDKTEFTDFVLHQGTIYAGYVTRLDTKQYENGLAISKDGGQSWTFKKISYGAGQLLSLSNIKVHDKTIVASADFKADQLLLFSDDEGEHWSFKETTHRGFNFSFENERLVIYARPAFSLQPTEQGGILISRDRGETWSRKTVARDGMLLGFTHIKAVEGTLYGLLFHDDSSLLATSTDGGASWHLEKLPQDFRATSLFVFDSIVYAGSFSGGMAFSKDQGRHWSVKSVAEGLPRSPISEKFCATIHDVYAQGHFIFAATSEGLALSADGGASWKVDEPSAKQQLSRSVDILRGAGPTLYAHSRVTRSFWVINPPFETQ